MEYKIVFAGQPGAGKTTAIQVLSDIEVGSTEARTSDDLAFRKATTTVAMDYGVIRLDDDCLVHLYGTPGQARFSFMWDILANGAMGVVVLIDATAPEALQELAVYLEAFKTFSQKGSVVIGLTHIDRGGAAGLDAFYTHLAHHGYQLPVMEVDARNHKDLSVLLLSFLAMLQLPVLSRQ